MVKKRLFRALVMLGVLLMVTSCKKEPITIGFTANLTGTGSEVAVTGMYGALTAVQLINEQGGIDGREVVLIIEDDNNSVSGARNADQRLIEQGALGIVGHMMSGVASESIDYINKQKVVMVSPTISSSNFSGKDDYFYTLMPISEYQSARISKGIMDKGFTKTGFLYQLENNMFAESMVDDTIVFYEDLDHKVVFKESYSYIHEASFKRVIDKIEAEGVDSLVIAGSAFDVAKYAQMMAIKGLKIPIFTSTWTMSPDLMAVGGPTTEGIYTVNAFDSSNSSQAFETFTKAYEATYGTVPIFSSVYAYEATNLLLEAIKASDSMDGPSIKAAMTGLRELDGLQGDISINEYGDATREVFLFQVKNGEFVKVD